MREIKFRAWVEETKYMRYDFDAIAWRSVRGQDFNGVHIVDFGYEDDDFTTAIIMQYTGLKDKNGKEIYEGDIVKAYGAKCKVRFEHGAFIIGYHDGSSTARRPQLIQGMVKDVATKIEVIGNIYENPELLTGK